MLAISCPCCHFGGEFPDDYRGSKVKCPRCQTVVTLPGTTSAEALPAAPGPVAADPQGMPITMQDQFFVLMAQTGRDAAPAIVSKPGSATVSTAAPQPPAPIMAPTPVKLGEAEDATAVRDWLRDELQRFNDHVAKQLSTLQQQRQDFVGWQSQAEATYLAREHEYNRTRANLSSRVTALDQREQALVRREAELAQTEERLSESQRAVQDLQSQRDALTGEIESQRHHLESLRAETDEARRAVHAAKDDYHAVAAELEAKQQDLAQREQRVADRHHHLEQRETELERGQTALEHRLVEIEELEEQIRLELEERERELVEERHLLQQRVEEARLHGPVIF